MNNSNFSSENEALRLEALRSYQILDTLTETEYDELTELASLITGTPISLISLIDENRQWFKSKKGISIVETDRSHSFCSHAIQNKDFPLIIPDARVDERFKNNPYVTQDPNIIFYAGIPLVDSDNFALGSLCVIDNQPKELNEKQIAALQTIAKNVVRLIEMRKSHRMLSNDIKLLTESLSLNNSFYLVVSIDGKIINFGENFKKVIPRIDANVHFSEYFLFDGGFSFKQFLESNIGQSQKLIFFTNIDKSQRYKCSLKKIDDVIIVSVAPVINAQFPLKEYNLSIADFAQHDYIAEYLFLQQTTQRSLKDSQVLTSKVIERNKELEAAQKNIDTLSRFPDENPNPVLRFNFDLCPTYNNPSSELFFLKDFGITKEGVNDATLKQLLIEMIDAEHPYFQKILERNNRHYSLTFKTVKEFQYINVYVSEITTFIEKVNANESALIQLKDKINEQREFYEFILNNIPADIAVFSKEHKYVYVNPQGIKNPELREFMIGKDDFDYCRYKGVSDDLAIARRSIFNKIIGNKEFINWEDEITDSNGNKTVIFRRMGPLFNAQGEVEYVIGYGVNITDRRIAEDNLIAANRRLNLLEKFIDRANDSIQVSDETGQLIYINKMASERLGIKTENVGHFKVQDFEATLKDDEKWQQHLEEIKKSGMLQIEGVNVNQTTNEVIDVEVNVNYEIIDGKGYIIAASRDITDKKRIQEEVRRLSLVAKNTNNGVLILDKNRKITWANAAMINRSGYTLEELVGNSPKIFQNEKTDIATVDRIFNKLIQNESVSEELLHVSKNGKEYWIDVNILPIYDDLQNHIGYIAIEFDITERKRFEQTIAEQNKSLKEITDALNESSLVSITDTKGIILSANSRFCAISGYSEKELIGRYHNIVNSNYHTKAFWAEVWQTISSGNVWQGEVKNKAKNGSYYWVNSVIYPIRDLNGKLIRYLSICHEITEKKEAEDRERERLRQLEWQQKALIHISKLPSTLTLKERLLEILKKDTEILQCENAAIWFHDSQNEAFELGYCYENSSQLFTTDKLLKKADHLHVYNTLLSSGCDIQAENVDNNLLTKGFKGILYSSSDVVSLLLVPIRIGGELIGFIAHEQVGEGKIWEESEVNFARSIADATALAIENFRKEEAKLALEGKSKFQNLLMEISTKYINLSNDQVKETIEQSLEKIGRYVGMDRVYIFEYDLNNYKSFCRFEWCKDGISSQMSVRQNIPIDTIMMWYEPHSKGEYFEIEDADLINDLELKERVQSREIKSLITIPLMNEGKCSGFVGFDAVTGKKKLSADERSLLALYSQMLVNVNVRAAYINQIEVARKEIEVINSELEQRVIQETQKNLDLAKSITDQEKLVTLGEISSGIAHDLNTPLGAIKSGAESIRFTLENLFKGTITNCTEDQVNFACSRAMLKDVELFVGGMQFIRESKELESYLMSKYPTLTNFSQLSEKLVKARIEITETDLIDEIISAPNALDYLDLIYHLKMIRTFVDTILKSSEKAARVIQDLRSFIKDPKNNNKVKVNLHQNISTVLNIFNFELKRTANVEFDVDESLEVEAFDIKLFQLWSNLIKNAIEAMEDKKDRGTLKISSYVEQNFINIVVQNDGPKIPSDIQSEIFNKFYTTKSEKNGTGLGLNIVKNIIDDHNAKISLRSTDEKTEFIITFNKPT